MKNSLIIDILKIIKLISQSSIKTLYWFMMEPQPHIFPRKRYRIQNINILLNSPPVPTPQQTIKIMTPSKQASSSQILNKSKKIRVKQQLTDNPIKVMEKKKLVNSIVNIQNENKNILNKINLQSFGKSRYTKSALEFRNTSSYPNHAKPSTSISKRNEQASSSQIVFNRTNQRQFRNISIVEMTSSIQLPPRSITPELKTFKNAQTQQNNDQDNFQHLEEYNYGEKSNRSKNFLKKGSGINKSIINNLIRMKISKHFTNSNNGFHIYVENDQILNLFKIYKNIQQIYPKTRTLSHQAKSRKNNGNCIQGWEKEKEEEEGDGHLLY